MEIEIEAEVEIEVEVDVELEREGDFSRKEHQGSWSAAPSRRSGHEECRLRALQGNFTGPARRRGRPPPAMPRTKTSNPTPTTEPPG